MKLSQGSWTISEDENGLTCYVSVPPLGVKFCKISSDFAEQLKAVITMILENTPSLKDAAKSGSASNSICALPVNN